MTGDDCIGPEYTDDEYGYILTMNADWKSSFAAALDERDTRELQNYDMLDYCKSIYVYIAISRAY